MELAKGIAREFGREFSMRELYQELARRHPPARKSEKRKTPWATFYRDLYASPNFVQVGRGTFRLTSRQEIAAIPKNTRKRRDELAQFEATVRKLQMLREAKLISEEEYRQKGKDLYASL